MKSEDGRVKVHDTLIECAAPLGEELWAFPLEEPGLYRIDSIPQFASGIHLEDVVRCERLTAGEATFLEVVDVVARSGWSTFRALLAFESMTAQVVLDLTSFGAMTVCVTPKRLVIAVPPSGDSEHVRAYLRRQGAFGILTFDEG